MVEIVDSHIYVVPVKNVRYALLVVIDTVKPAIVHVNNDHL